MSEDPGAIAYWSARWAEGRTGFHQDAVNHHLRQHGDHLVGQRVLVPLAGKTLDIPWLMQRHDEVIAIEASAQAAEEFHREQGLEPERGIHGPFEVLSSPGLRFLVGDFYAASVDHTGPIDAVWDRAALIAMPPERRPDYAAKITDLCGPHATALLVTMVYEQAKMAGPPFCVPAAEVAQLYGAQFSHAELARLDITNEGPKFAKHGLQSVEERVFALCRSRS